VMLALCASKMSWQGVILCAFAQRVTGLRTT
jgi:hypothetical protein